MTFHASQKLKAMVEERYGDGNEQPQLKRTLPPIPAKRYFTIGEVSELCGVKPHVLRYWEQEFTQLKPVKRRGNRRYYQHHEVLLIRRIRELLYEQGFTISGARNRLGRARLAEPRCKADARARADVEALPLLRKRNCEDRSRACLRGISSVPAVLALVIIRQPRGVAQPGSAPAWGAGGRRFKSSRPDQQSIEGSIRLNHWISRRDAAFLCARCASLTERAVSSIAAN